MKEILFVACGADVLPSLDPGVARQGLLGLPCHQVVDGVAVLHVGDVLEGEGFVGEDIDGF